MKNIPKQNIGKIFEQNWRKSCPSDILIYKPPDAAQSFNMNSNLRFSQRSPCDYMMFDGNILYTLELKSFEGSCSFERTKDDNGIIHYYQIQSLKHFGQFKNICSGFMLDFRKSDNTYFLDINEWDGLINSISKKSFNESDLFEFCNPLLIKKKKLKVNYRYDIQDFVYQINKKYNLKGV